MKAIIVNNFGDSDALCFGETKKPSPGKGEVLVKVAAIGLNFTDIYLRTGLYPNALPFIPGYEFSGTVESLGEGVKDFQLGDRVCTANGVGGYAEYAIAPATKLIPIPDTLSFEMAAAIILQGMTAHYLATSTYPIKPGDKVLVHAAAGGVGQLLIQIAKLRGSTVFATVSNEEKAQIARKLGADYVIIYTENDFEVAVTTYTQGNGLDVVYDGVGKVTFMKSLNCLKPRGMMVLYGQASGPVESIDPQILNRKGSLYLTRPTLGHYQLSRLETMQRADDLFKWLDSGEIKIEIDQKFSLMNASVAHRYMESRSTKGKVLIIP